MAPINQTKITPEALLQDEALAEEVIANHFLLGEEIRLEELKTDQKRHTAGGQPLVFKVDKNGEQRQLCCMMLLRSVISTPQWMDEFMAFPADRDDLLGLFWKMGIISSQ